MKKGNEIKRFILTEETNDFWIEYVSANLKRWIRLENNMEKPYHHKMAFASFQHAMCKKPSEGDGPHDVGTENSLSHRKNG